jgi:hypothetical protein
LPHDTRPFLANKVFLDAEGVRIPCSPKELQLLGLIMNNLYNQFFMLDQEKWIDDLNIVIKNYDLDWDGFIGHLASLNQAEVVYLTITLLNSFNPRPIMVPPAVMARLRARSPSWKMFVNKPVFMWLYYLARDKLFPPKESISKTFDVTQGSRFFFLCYLANLITLPLRSFNAALAICKRYRAR